MDLNRLRTRLHAGQAGAGEAAGLITTIVVVVLLLVAGYFLVVQRSVDAGEVALRFGGGAFDTRNGQFKEVHHPGRSNMGLADRVFPYPDTVRNFTFAADPDGEGPRRGGDAGPVPCATKSTDAGSGAAGPRVDMSGQFLFFLNTQIPKDQTIAPLGEFHRLFGVRFHAYNGFDDPDYPDSDGWPAMLDQTFRPVAESAITAACRNFEVDDLTKQAKIDELEATVGKTVTARLPKVMGGVFFCGAHDNCTAPIVFQMKPVLPPKALTDAAERLTVAQKNLAAAKEEAKSIDAARGKGLDGMAYVANECRKDPACVSRMTLVLGNASVAVGPGTAR